MQLSVIFKLNLVSFFLLFTFWVLCIKNKTKTKPRWTTRTICQNIFATSYWIINSIQIGPYSFFSPQQLRKKQKIKGGKYFQPVAAFNLKNLTKQSKQSEDFFSVAASATGQHALLSVSVYWMPQTPELISLWQDMSVCNIPQAGYLALIAF